MKAQSRCDIVFRGILVYNFVFKNSPQRAKKKPLKSQEKLHETLVLLVSFEENKD